MQWHSVSEFFAMGGYAPYVWGSVGACALAMLVEPWLLHRQHRDIVEALRRQRDAWQAAEAGTGVGKVVAIQRRAA
jgi:heme exporter protein D